MASHTLAAVAAGLQLPSLMKGRKCHTLLAARSDS